MNATKLSLDPYIVNTLMPDLVGHDHSPSAFLVYLHLWANGGIGRVAISHRELAERTGLSKRAIQNAIGLLKRRQLLLDKKRRPTEVSEYQVMTPWNDRHRQ